MPVRFSGILPDLFAEGEGVVAEGVLDDNGMLIATQVLAKHDENYMPPEVAAALEGKTAPGEAIGSAMIPELGHVALIIAFCLAVALAVIPLWGTPPSKMYRQ